MSSPFRDGEEGLRARSAEVRVELEKWRQREVVAADRLQQGLERLEELTSPRTPRWRLRLFVGGLALGAFGALVSVVGR